MELLDEGRTREARHGFRGLGRVTTEFYGTLGDERPSWCILDLGNPVALCLSTDAVFRRRV